MAAAIAILGASGHIGTALANYYSDDPDITLYLYSRSPDATAARLAAKKSNATFHHRDIGALDLSGCDIVINALAIGATTFVMVTIGMMTGRYLGEKFGHYAETAGGVVLILIGIAILAEHTLV